MKLLTLRQMHYTVRMDIGSLIPHRPPFLFVDEVVRVEPQRVVTRWRAREDADFFAGHYPGNPIMPGVLVCECAFQAGALLLATQSRNGLGRENVTQPTGSAVIPVLTRIKSAAFKRMVRPGDTLEVEVTIDECLEGAFFMIGRVSVAGKLAVRVEFACTLSQSVSEPVGSVS